MIYRWIEVGDIAEADLKDAIIVEATVAEKKICLLKRQEKVFAFAATCPHQSAKLCEGWLDAQGRVVCPLHKYRFDPVNGRNTSGEGYKLRTYPVEIRDGFIYIGLLE